MDLGLRGKRALVTGGTRGLGRAIAERLCAEGADVAICARDRGAVDEACDALARSGTRIWGCAADVGSEESYRAWLDAAVAELGGCDIFVFNTSAAATRDDDEAWRRSCEVDLLGASRGVRALTPVLIESQGAILFVASLAAVERILPPMAYSAAKAALINYAKALSAQLGRKGVRVNSISPGCIEYPGGDWERVKQNAPDVYDAMQARTALGYLGAPSDIADASAFLVSPAARYITGINLLVDGGASDHVGA